MLAGVLALRVIVSHAQRACFAARGFRALTNCAFPFLSRYGIIKKSASLPFIM